MKQKLLLLFFSSMFAGGLCAQKTTGFAITATQKGQSDWCEVRLVDLNSGEEVKSVYKSKQDVKLLNARTGKAIAAKESSDARVKSDNPFATNSAACAYDKKHERLYYTPMGINQLRYIDLKAKSPAIYYFEDESFGAVAGRHDVANQITRMVIASDGNGYALSNDGNHLIQFTTKKKPVITDLGELLDDPANAASVHSGAGYGGDMIADAEGNLFLVTANRGVFMISLKTKVASFQGYIQGLPRGFTTNGAMVEEGSKVIVCSSNSTQGYYRFDLTTLQAEKISGGGVYNASDLANGSLAFEKKKKKQQKEEPQQPVRDDEDAVAEAKQKPVAIDEVVTRNSISVFPNPVTTGLVKVSFADQAPGRYNLQLVDISGKLISEREVIVTSKLQVEEFRLPELVTKGSYLMKVSSTSNKVNYTSKILVQ